MSAGILDPQGPVGVAEKTILLNSLAIMLAVVIPTIIATLVTAWWFRGSNRRAKYLPDWTFNGQLELVTWAIPVMVVILLGGIAWIGSHDLDPQKPLASARPPVRIDVVSLDWKWLFIYRDLGVATVNQLIVPVNAPLEFRLTSGSVMNSFFIPQLGSQIYTMAGMTTSLHLQADKPGRYPGFSAQLSGARFSDMHFDADAIAPSEFRHWIDAQRGRGSRLDAAAYAALAKPGVPEKSAFYGSIAPGLFEFILQQTSAPTAEPVDRGHDHGSPATAGEIRTARTLPARVP